MAKGKRFLEWVAGVDADQEEHARLGAGYSISPGTVVDNLNFLSEGRVQVHIPTLPSFDPWARPAAVGGGPGRGFVWIPQVDDEVLVAFNQNDERDAYILGGLWSMSKRPPITDPQTFLSKRVLKTGTKGCPYAQTVELDDLQQSVTITTSVGHSITMGLKQIEISAQEGVMKITMDLGPPPAISIQATAGNIELKAPVGKISLQGAQVEITSTTTATIQASALCSIQGAPIKIN
jgi:phage baseplate assembly protein gpV